MNVSHTFVELGHSPETGMIGNDDEADEDKEGDEFVVSSLDKKELIGFSFWHLSWFAFDAVAAAAE